MYYKVGCMVSGLAVLASCGDLVLRPADGSPSWPAVIDMGGKLDLIKTPATYFRLGNFVVDAAPLDVCVKGPSDADFQGPLVRLQTQRPGGMFYTEVSAYVTVAPAHLIVRGVVGGAVSCTTSLVGFPDTELAPLALGHHYTVAATGVLARPATIKFNLIEDDLSTQGGQVRLRFINAAADLPSADLGFGSGAQYMAQLSGATYGSIGFASGQVYLTTTPLINATIAVQQSGVGTDALVIPNKANIAVGTVATAIIAGVPGDPFTPLSLVLCNDSVPTNDLTSCYMLR